jgi:hypothetical protein
MSWLIAGQVSQSLDVRLAPDVLQAVLAENKRMRDAHAAADLALDAITPEQFATRTSGASVTELLTDPEFAEMVETLTGKPEIQNAALDARLNRTLLGTLDILSNRVASPECSATAAREVGDTLVKVANLVDRRKVIRQRDPERRMMLFMGDASINTPEGQFRVSVDSEQGAIGVIRAMRCTTESEAETVLDVFRQSLTYGELVLRGW